MNDMYHRYTILSHENNLLSKKRCIDCECKCNKIGEKNKQNEIKRYCCHCWKKQDKKFYDTMFCDLCKGIVIQ